MYHVSCIMYHVSCMYYCNRVLSCTYFDLQYGHHPLPAIVRQDYCNVISCHVIHLGSELIQVYSAYQSSEVGPRKILLRLRKSASSYH